MYRKVAKLGAVKTDRNWSRSERKLAVSCMGGLLVARVPGCRATSRIHPSRREVAIPHAYDAPAKSAKPEPRRRGIYGRRSESLQVASDGPGGDDAGEAAGGPGKYVCRCPADA